MPRIPTYDLPQVLPELGPQPQASPEAFGAGIGRSMQGLGQDISRAANVASEHVLRFQREQNESFANEQMMDYTLRARQAETEFLLLEGNQKAQQYESYSQKLEALRQEVVNRAPNQYTRRLLEAQVMNRHENFLVEGSRAAAFDNRKYMVSQLEARAALAADDMANGDEVRAGLNVSDIEQAAEQMSKILGLPPEAAELKKRELLGQAYSTRIAKIAEENPLQARDYLGQVAAKLSPDVRLRLDGVIKNQIATVEVKRAQDAFVEGREPGLNGSFKEVLGTRESAGSGGYRADNGEGYIGKYQFGTARLSHLGLYSGKSDWSGELSIPGHPEVKTIDDFKNSPDAQEVAWTIHERKMEKEITENGFDKYEGQEIEGVVITRNGIKAMLHLSGPGGTKQFLEGRGSRRDSNQTPVREYAILGGAASTTARKPITHETTEEEFNAIVEEARTYARTVAPGVPEFETNLVSGLKTDWNVFRKMAKEEADQNFNSLYSLVLPQPDGTGGLTEIPKEYIPIWNKLKAEQKNTLLGQLKDNASPERKSVTPEQQNTYWQLLVKDNLTVDDVAKADLYPTHRTELFKEATSPQRKQAEMDNTEALGDISFITDEVFGRGEKRKDNKYKAFAGHYLSKLRQLEAQGKPVDDATKVKIATDLLKSQTVVRRAGKVGSFFGSTTYTERLPTYEAASEEELDVIRQEFPELTEEEVMEMWHQEMQGL